MGYTTDFVGEIKVTPTLGVIHHKWLCDFSDARHSGDGYPGIWCQWRPNDNGTAIVWDGGEKFYRYTEWLKYLIDNMLSIWHYQLNGEIEWQGEDGGDFGKIVVASNVVSTLPGRKVYGP